MNNKIFEVKEYFQKAGSSCLAASALCVLNYFNPDQWALNEFQERRILEEIQFDKDHNWGCYTKLIHFLLNCNYKVGFLLGSIPQEKHSNEKILFDIWIKNYEQIKNNNNVEIQNIQKKDILKKIDEIIFKEESPLIFYSNKLWHNMVIQGKINDQEYLIFDPLKGKKIYHSSNLIKNLLSPWGINAIYLKNGRNKTGKYSYT